MENWITLDGTIHKIKEEEITKEEHSEIIMEIADLLEKSGYHLVALTDIKKE